MRQSLRVTALTLLALAASCGGSGDTTYPSGTTNTTTTTTTTSTGGSTSPDITVEGSSSFNPAATTVPPGTRVNWTWANNAGTHTVTFDDGVNSGNLSSGTFSRTFNVAGTFPYHCLIHGVSMSGTVTVK